MQELDVLQIALQFFENQFGKHGHSVLIAFAGTDANLPGGKIDIFHTQPQAFHEAEACAVQNAGHNFFPPGKIQQNAADLILSQDHGKALRPFCPLDMLESAKLFVKNVFIEKNYGI